MHATTRQLLGFGVAATAIAATLGCDLDECDPTVDPTCEVEDAGDAGGGDTGGGGTDTGPDPAVYRYLYLFDLSDSLSGPHPGADIDAVELVRGGRSFYATTISDRGFEPGLSNEASASSAMLGAPQATGNPPRCNLSANPPHWYSLGGGFVVVDFGSGVAIQDGDEIVIYECSGTSGGVDDPYGFGIGELGRVDAPGAQYVTVVDEGVGYLRIRVDFDGLGI